MQGADVKTLHKSALLTLTTHNTAGPSVWTIHEVKTPALCSTKNLTVTFTFSPQEAELSVFI